MSNQEIAKILMEMATLYEIEGVQFKPRAYEKAAQGVESYTEDIEELYRHQGTKALSRVPGVGKGIAAHIEELLTIGHFKEYEQLKRKTPVNISELIQVEGLGPRSVKVLWEKLKIRTLDDLEKAARHGKVRTLSHFGERSEQKILKGIEFLRTSGGRRILGFALPDIRKLEDRIRGFRGVEGVVVAGSVRRRKETIGDIDIVVTSEDGKRVIEQFVTLPEITHIYGKGPTKTNVRLASGLDADLRVVPRESFGAAVNYFTGSKNHNIKLREIAIKKGWKLNEYGLFNGTKRIAGATEEEIYNRLGLDYIEPELREDTGEIDAARAHKLPKLVGYGDLKGDLQVQTNWTDGKDSIEDMAEAARKAGFCYIAITDHTKSLAMTRGSDEAKLRTQMKEIDALNEKLAKRGVRFKTLKGAEVNIMKDGTLDISDTVLNELDVVGAAVHTHFALSREEQTKRVIRAMENPNVDIIFHLTARLINRREPIMLDVDAVIGAAKRTGTIFEIDAYPDRLDIKDEYVRRCVEEGVNMCVDSDAHATGHFSVLEFGIAQARRGWSKKEDIVNTLPLKKFLQTLKK